jgi:hypothetical protein
VGKLQLATETPRFKCQAIDLAPVTSASSSMEWNSNCLLQRVVVMAKIILARIIIIIH